VRRSFTFGETRDGLSLLPLCLAASAVNRLPPFDCVDRAPERRQRPQKMTANKRSVAKRPIGSFDLGCMRRGTKDSVCFVTPDRAVETHSAKTKRKRRSWRPKFGGSAVSIISECVFDVKKVSQASLLIEVEA